MTLTIQITLLVKRRAMAEVRIPSGRPRIPVDYTIVSRLREVENLGWSRMAQVYQKTTGQYISRDTIKRRYLEAKAQEASITKTPD
jgi:hypothetical protein